MDTLKYQVDNLLKSPFLLKQNTFWQCEYLVLHVAIIFKEHLNQIRYIFKTHIYMYMYYHDRWSHLKQIIQSLEKW